MHSSGYLLKITTGTDDSLTKYQQSKQRDKNQDLNAEIAIHGDIVGPVGEEITRIQWEVPTLHQYLPLLFIEIGGERGEIELGEIGALQDGVHAVHGAQLPLLYLVVKEPSIARSFHFLRSDERSSREELNY